MGRRCSVASRAVSVVAEIRAIRIGQFGMIGTDAKGRDWNGIDANGSEAMRGELNCFHHPIQAIADGNGGDRNGDEMT